MRLSQIRGLWKDAAITVVGAACVYLVIGFGGELGRLQSGSPIGIGVRMSIPGESTRPGHRDLIIIGSDSCRFSRESIEFDRKLLMTAVSVGVPVRVISPTRTAAAWYVRQLAVPSSSVLVHSLMSIGITVTPTVILRDESGVVQGLWEGLLPANEQNALLLRVGERKHILEQPHFEELTTYSQGGGVETKPVSPLVPRPVVEVDESDVNALGANHTVVDLRERASLVQNEVANEINIPFPELDVRARIELKPDTPIIVDCSSIDVGTCDLAAFKLVSLKFTSIAVLDRGSRGRACRVTPVRKF